jgi:hypothetical protein
LPEPVTTPTAVTQSAVVASIVENKAKEELLEKKKKKKRKVEAGTQSRSLRTVP